MTAAGLPGITRVTKKTTELTINKTGISCPILLKIILTIGFPSVSVAQQNQDGQKRIQTPPSWKPGAFFTPGGNFLPPGMETIHLTTH
jgi:hypothetical protein